MRLPSIPKPWGYGTLEPLPSYPKLKVGYSSRSKRDTEVTQ